MPQDKHDEWTRERDTLNVALAASTTHEIIALYKVSRKWPEPGYLLHRDITGWDVEGNPIWLDVFMTDDMLTGAKLAYEWLNARGLA